MLVPDRTNRRWGIPKGHLEAGEATKAEAARKAFEEAGVVGAPTEHSVGGFTCYNDISALICRVRAHLIAVQSIASDCPERDFRSNRWVPASIAACEVGSPGFKSSLSAYWDIWIFHKDVRTSAGSPKSFPLDTFCDLSGTT